MCLRWHPRFVIGSSRVAPVRGGTYFLCRRKESKQRKRANTARPCPCLRAPNGSSTSHGVLPFNARCQHFGYAPHPLQSPVAQPAAANGYGRPGGKLCVGRSAPHVSALTTPIVLSSRDLGFQSGVERIRRDSLHTVCRYRTWEIWSRMWRRGRVKRVMSQFEALAAGVEKNDAA